MILKALNKNILYFNSPTDIKINQNINFDKKIRVGGMVKQDTLKIKDQEIRFIITDFKNEINEFYTKDQHKSIIWKLSMFTPIFKSIIVNVILKTKS